MKKLISVLLAGIMAISISVFGVNAEENDRFSTKQSNIGLIYVDSQTKNEYILLAEGENSDGSEFLLVQDMRAVCDELLYKALGDYMLFNPQTDGGSEGPFAIIKNNDVSGAYAAYENDWIEDKAFYDAMKKTTFNKYISLIGDVNNDGVLSILDATLIQKNLTENGSYYNLATSNKLTLKRSYIADFNKDNSVNVSDATSLQKKLVEQQ